MSADLFVKLHESLTEVRRAFDADQDDWRYKALKTYRELLRSLGVERHLCDAIQAMLLQEQDATLAARRRESGEPGTPKPPRKVAATAYAAAAVTYLRLRHNRRVAEALKLVASASGIEKDTIAKLRNNISRGGKRTAQGAPAAYEQFKREFMEQNYSEADVMGAVKGIGKFVD